MRVIFAKQYSTGCIVVESAQEYDAEWLIERAAQAGAFFHDGEGEVYVIQLPGRPPEPYTQSAIERTCSAKVKEATAE